MHHRAGERAVGARQQCKVHIGQFGRPGAVRIDDDELRAALPARLRDLGHHIDLGRYRVAAPDDDQVGLGHFARVGAAFRADPGEPAGVGQRHADCRILPRVAHRVPQPVLPVALHEPHRPGVVMRPHGLANRGAAPPGSAARQFRRARRPRRPGRRRRGPCPSRRPAAAARKAARDGAGARHSGRPWRRRRPACRTAPRRRAPGRYAGRSTRSTASAQALGQSCGQTL